MAGARTYYKRDANPTNANWAQADNWSTVASNSPTNTGTWPTSLDTAVFDASSASCTVPAGTPAACAVVNMTNYMQTFTINDTLTTTGNVTWGGTITGSGTWYMTTSCLIATMGVTCGCNLKFGGTGQTFTLTASGITVSGTTTFQGTSSLIFGNGTYAAAFGAVVISGPVTFIGSGTVTASSVSLGAYTLTIASNWTLSGGLTLTGSGTITGAYNFTIGTHLSMASYILSGTGGTATVVMGGTGQVTCSNSTCLIGNNFTINTAGTITFPSSNYFGMKLGKTFTRTAGTVVVNSGHVFNMGTFTFNATYPNVTWGVLAGDSSAVVTLSGEHRCVQLSSGVGGTTLNGYSIGVSSSLSFPWGNFAGTTEIVLLGGSWSSNGSGYSVANNLTINGNVTIGTSVYYAGGSGKTLKYTSGTVNVAGSTLYLTGSCTLNTGNLKWNTVNITATGGTFETASAFNAATLRVSGSGTIIIGTAPP